MISIIEMGDEKAVDIQKVSSLERVSMKEKLSETGHRNEYKELHKRTFSWRPFQTDGQL